MSRNKQEAAEVKGKELLEERGGLGRSEEVKQGNRARYLPASEHAHCHRQHGGDEAQHKAGIKKVSWRQ